MTDNSEKNIIDSFGKPFITKEMRYESIPALKARFKKLILAIFVMIAVLIFMHIRDMNVVLKNTPIRLDYILIFVVFFGAISSIQIKRFIGLREQHDNGSNMKDSI